MVASSASEQYRSTDLDIAQTFEEIGSGGEAFSGQRRTPSGINKMSEGVRLCGS